MRFTTLPGAHMDKDSRGLRMHALPPEQWDPSLQYIIDEMNGEPINIHRLLANHPPLLKAWWGYRMYFVSGGALEKREAELVILRVAVLMKAWYEWAAHVDRGLASGLSIEDIERVAAGPAAADWSEKDSDLLRSVDALVAERCLQPYLRMQLERHFSERQILDIVSLQGMYVTIASMLATWPIEIEDAVLRRIPESVTEQSFADLISAANRD
jgi:4-carboxymuconolactone decarboxylase